MTARTRLASVPGAQALYHRVRAPRTEGGRGPALSFRRAPAKTALRLAYQVMLGRDPDPVGLATHLPPLRTGASTIDELVALLRCSEEFNARALPPQALVSNLHLGRQQFIRSLPRARRILDLGGTHLASGLGALVTLGYPYPFEELVIVDLPTEERHQLYRSAEHTDAVVIPAGTIRYSYHSMTDLGRFADGSVDLVYSGQSIEHVTPDDGARVLEEVVRVLRPGGALALDTPNGRVTRMQQAAFIDPDHEVEYTWPQLRALLEDAGLVVERAHGLTWVPTAAEGRFDPVAAGAHPGMHDAIDDCYLLAVVCRKP
ncbi:MAG TPA: methyltransferase domain-containing protein [Acidimicrobiales bacterium]|nr:methyltransferase domain-containing protein [Acidimicrobiales bacterium]